MALLGQITQTRGIRAADCLVVIPNAKSLHIRSTETQITERHPDRSLVAMANGIRGWDCVDQRGIVQLYWLILSRRCPEGKRGRAYI